MQRVVVVVVAGGSGTRFAAAHPGDPAVDKLVVPLGDPAGTPSAAGAGVPVLSHLVTELVAQWPVLVVGPDRDLPHGDHPVRTVREDPPGGGPLAGFAAGLDAVAAVDPPVDVVVLVGGDQPFAATAVPRLVAALQDPAARAAVGVDGTGRRQPLLSAHRRDAVSRVLAGLPDPAGLPLRHLFRDSPGAGAVVEVAVDESECLDVDVPADLERARAVLARAGSTRRT